MNLKNIVRRLGNGELHFVVGRFRTVRVAYSRVRGGLESLKPPSDGADDNGVETIFPDLDVDQAVEAIRREAVFTDLRLPAPITEEIERFCRSEPLFARDDPDGPRFHHADVVNGYTPDGRPCAIGPITDPMRCTAVRRIVEDPVLRAVAKSYLGYTPRNVLPLLYWSFASSFSDEERRRLLQHVIDYHYDITGFNFVYASFYIIPCHRGSGAHVMMRRSHLRKPLRMLMGTVVASEEDVHREFGAENELVVEGPAGAGFIQDTSCFHRATPPTMGDRLMLQIRFS